MAPKAAISLNAKSAREIPGTRQQGLHRTIPQGGRPTVLSQLYQQILVHLQPEGAGCFHDLPPTIVRIDRLLLPFHERYSAVSQVHEMLDCEISGLLVVQLDISYSGNILVAGDGHDRHRDLRRSRSIHQK